LRLPHRHFSINKRMRIHEIIDCDPNSIAESLTYQTDPLLEGFLDSAAQFLGAKKDATIADIKGSITDMTSAGILIKEVAKYPRVGDMALSELVRLNNQLVASIDTASVKNNTLNKLWTKIKPMLTYLRSGREIWRSFMGNLGIYGFLKFITDRTVSGELTDAVSNALTDQLARLVEVFEGIALGGLGPFLLFFKALTTVKKHFFDVLTQLRQQIISKSQQMGLDFRTGTRAAKPANT
jgi:hypothetical protein